jgi:putative transposase
MGVLRMVSGLLRLLLASRAGLAAENLPLRQQLVVLKRSVMRPKLRRSDRVYWVWLSRLWARWRSCLLIVQPETGTRWHQEGFRLYWRRKSRKARPGRPRIEAEIRRLIRRMSRENPTWGAPRIQSELQLLGYTAAESTVAELVCGAADRLDWSRMPGSRDCSERGASAAGPGVVLRVLPHLANPSLAGSERAD